MTATDKGNYIQNEEMVRVLRAAVAEARKDVRRFDMDFWIRRAGYGFGLDRTEAFIKYHSECGTTLCLASLILTVAPPEYFTDNPPARILTAAKQIAGLSHDQAHRLFVLLNWPAAYQALYSRAKSPGQLVDALEERVEHFIRTGE